jgi:hypothetical protein
MNTGKRPALRLLLATALLGAALPAIPQAATTFTVEVLVFRNGSDIGALPDSARPPVDGEEVTATAVSSRRLGGSVARLNGNGMRVLGHGAWSQEPAAWRSRRGVSAARLGGVGISGKVIFERGSQSLHLGVDIVVEDGGKRYRVDEVRPVKAGEIQYFDHPAIGVLAIATEG